MASRGVPNPHSTSGQTDTHSTKRPNVSVRNASRLWPPSKRTGSPSRHVEMPMRIGRGLESSTTLPRDRHFSLFTIDLAPRGAPARRRLIRIVAQEGPMTRCGPFLVVWATSISAHHRWPFEGVSLRLFDLADSLWRIYWIDSTRVTDLKECFEGRQPRLG